MTPTAHATLVDRFATWVRRRPDATALVDGDRRLTYAELFAQAEALAGELAAAGVRPGTLVGLRVGRCAEVVVGVLGILGAGCGYVPVDPGYPRERQDYILRDSGVDAVVVLDDDGLRVTRIEPEIRHDIPSDIAYVIYTSGSTGRPKGVLVGNRQVLSLLDACDELYEFSDRDVWTMFHSPSFDFSVWELWGALSHGGCLVIVPPEIAASPPAFAGLLAQERVTVLNQVPTAFGYLVASLEDEPRALPDLRYVIFGGEAVNPVAVERWVAAGWAPGASVVNMYGITETTVHVTHCLLGSGSTGSVPGTTPIGTPLPHLRVHVVDADLRPVPAGVAGELVISGAGVSHGYLNRPELTAARFVRLAGVDGPAYRSGDHAILDPRGRLHYVGRRDAQIQLRGFRIEPGEIEAALAAHPDIRECAIIVATNRLNEPILEAHYVSRPRTAPTPATLRTYLSGILPPHMLPSRYHAHPALPLTCTGKLDRAALA